jgi:DNA-binding MarR family transcriptional regulator
MTSAPASTSELGLDLAVRLRTAVTLLSRRLRQESLGVLSPTQASSLGMIARLSNPTLGELARAEKMQPPTVTKIISGMEEMGLVEREVDGADRRITRVRLSVEGRRELERVRTLKTAFLVERLGSLEPHELARVSELAELLERIEAGE